MDTPILDTQRGDKNYAPEFMLQEHSRIIDAYHDLHVQKNELIKIYLAFASLPLVIVTIFLGLFKYLQPSLQTSSLMYALQIIAISLSVLLVLVGTSVLMSMLNIRSEQYLYIKTINAVRNYFQKEYQIPAEFLVLPTSSEEVDFGQEEPTGRPFWETMIVGSTSSLLLGFLAGETVYHISCLGDYALSVGLIAFLLAGVGHIWFVQRWITKTLVTLQIRVR
jgi:hypothetical protein